MPDPESPTASAKILRQRHSRFAGLRVRRWRALFEGGERFVSMLAAFMPQRPAETDDQWASRRAHAIYLNYAGSLAGFFPAMLLTEDPNLEGGSKIWIDWLDKLDGGAWYDDDEPGGRGFGSFVRGWFSDAVIARRAVVWIDWPESGPPGSRLDQERSGKLRPILRRIPAELIVNWGRDDEGRLSWVIIESPEVRQPDPLAPPATFAKWTVIDSERVRVYEAEIKGSQTIGEIEQAKLVRDVVHGMRDASGAPTPPLVELNLPAGLHAMGKLEPAAVGQFRRLNALEHSLDQTAFAMPAIKRKWGAGEEVMGAGYYWKLDREDSIEWAEPGGASYAAQATSAESLRTEMHRIVHQMALAADPSSTGLRQSGESKQSDWDSLRIVLRAYRRELLDGIAAIFEKVEPTLKGDTPKVSGLDAFERADVASVLEAALNAVALNVPSETFRKSIMKRVADRMLPDITPEERNQIHEEIDAHDPAEDRVPFAATKPPEDDEDEGDDDDDDTGAEE